MIPAQPSALLLPATDRRSGIASTLLAAGLSAIVAGWSPSLQAQVASKPDGRWRYALGAGLTLARGNSESLAYHLRGDAAFQDAARKIALYGSANYSKNDEVVSTHTAGFGGRWSWDLWGDVFAFGQGDWFRDRLANLSYRVGGVGGLGYHLWRQDGDYWDVGAGVGYTRDVYSLPTEVADGIRTRYGRFEAFVGTETQHALTSTTTFKQRLAVFPNLDEQGEYRATYDASLAVTMTQRLALTATLAVRRNSDPGTGVQKNDTLFVTGVSWKLE